MRVTEEMLYRMINSNVSNKQESIYRYQQQIASGRKVSHASDDPSAFATIGLSHFELSNINQYSKNAEYAKTKLLNMDSMLQSMIQIFHRASEIAIRGSDATMEFKQSLGHEANHLLESLIAIANSSESGSYVFSGLKSDTLPYLAEDTNSDGMIDKITYQGSTEVQRAEIGKNAYISTNIPGSDRTGANGVFQTQTEDLFAGLIQLRDRLLANENTIVGESFTAPGPYPTETLSVQNVYTTGSRVKISTTGTLPAGLSANATYYVIKISATEIELASSLENAMAIPPIPISMADGGSGTHTIEPETLKDLNSSLNHVINTLTIAGAQQERIRIHDHILKQRVEGINDILDKKENIDIAEAMMNLSQKQYAYEAALRAASMVLNQPSLIDFIR